MKKLTLLIFVLVITIFSSCIVFADGAENSGEFTSSSYEEKFEDRQGNASKTTLKNLVSREERIAEYTEKLGGDKTNGVVLYYLVKVQEYSIPVCFIGLVIASLNFFIIGNKKLEKRESGFKMLVTLIVGLIVFQVLPLLFAIVAGRWYTNESSICSW